MQKKRVADVALPEIDITDRDTRQQVLEDALKAHDDFCISSSRGNIDAWYVRRWFQDLFRLKPELKAEVKIRKWRTKKPAFRVTIVRS